MTGVPKVLVVDDEMKIARLVRDYLTEAGFDVALASTGPAAVAAGPLGPSRPCHPRPGPPRDGRV